VLLLHPQSGLLHPCEAPEQVLLLLARPENLRLLALACRLQPLGGAFLGREGRLGLALGGLEGSALVFGGMEATR
jgi:hypothetical protein